MMDWAIFVLRVVLGFIFLGHGLQKCFGLFAGPGIGGFSEMLSGMGFKPALFWAYIAAYTELIGSLCLISGVFIRIAAVFLLILMIVAIFKVHLTKGLFLSAGGFEYALLIAAACLTLAIAGAGKLSIAAK